MDKCFKNNDAFNQSSQMLRRAGWIPACAGMTFFSVLFFMFSLSFAKAEERMLIRGGNASKIHISIEKAEADTGRNKKILKKIKYRVTKQLEDSQLFQLSESSVTDYLKKFLISQSFEMEKDIFSKLEIKLKNQGLGKILLEVKLTDPYVESMNSEISYSFSYDEWFKAAAEISDLVYEKYTSLEGYFHSKIVFISETGEFTNRKKRVAIMGLYGDEYRDITAGTKLVLTPRLSPNGEDLIFISYSDDKPGLYMFNLKDKSLKKLVKDFDGMLYAPRFSPDGSKVIMAATYEGNSEIAILDLETKELKRLTNHYAIDTSPDFAPDGERIVFSSDRRGRQGLYIMDLNNEDLQYIEFEKANYANPVWSYDGKYIAFTRILKNRFSIGILNMRNYEVKYLTESYKDESPSWSTNSKFIMFNRKKATQKNLKSGLSNLYILNLNGDLVTKVRTPNDASEPFWASP